MVFAQAPIGLAFWGRDLRYRRINAALGAMNGASPDAHLGRTVEEMLPDLSAELSGLLRRVLATGEPVVGVEISGETPAAPGWKRKWMASYYRVTDGSAEPVGVGAVVLDTTERQLAESALRETEELKTAILDSTIDCVITIDARGRVLEFNHAAETTFGYTRDQALGREMAELIVPERLREAHRRGLERFAETGEGALLGQRLELTGLRADGAEFPVELTITRVGATDPAVFSGVLRDIGDRLRVEQERDRLLEREQAARREAERLAERSNLLAEASVMVNDSLDYRSTLDAAAHAAVPGFADWCLVELLRDDGSLELVAVAHADPEREQRARVARGRYPSSPDAQTGAARVVRTGRSELIPEVPPSALEAAAQDAENLRLLRELGPRSAVVVPLRTHGRMLGAVSLVSAESGRVFDEQDLDTAEQLASRCAAAVENARLYNAAADSEERFRLLIDGVKDYAILMLDCDGNVASWNTGAQRIKGYQTEEIVGRHFSCFYTPEGRERGKPDEELRIAVETGRYEDEGWRVRKDGALFWAHVILTALYDGECQLRGFSKVTHDATGRKRLEDELSHRALHDPLTNLPNRALFVDHVELALRRAARSGSWTAVLFIDLDRFKLVNDSLGHAAGDELLVAVAARLRDAVRDSDTVGRLSGDEFTALCEDIVGEADAGIVAERIIAALAEPIEIAGQEIFVGSSIGIGLVEGGAKDAEALLREADAAMYEAKHRGRTRYELYDQRLRSRAAERLRTESELRRAIEGDELRLVYQPQVDLASGRVVGTEALVRWSKNGGKLVSPAEFIPLAEETGLIVELGVVVLEAACHQAASWRAEGGATQPSLVVAVNVSPTQLSEPLFMDQLDAALALSGVDPSLLWLEVTESALMRDLEATAARLAEISALGVRIAIDDFGTGYSSLAHLRQLPVHAVKVDRSFVDGLALRPEDRAVVSAITGMGHALNLDVVAEGVETQDQVCALQALGCDLAQGYHFGRPVPPEELDRTVVADRS